MSRIILHCGLHKSGSTSLQVVLRDAVGALREHGVLYPCTGRFDRLGGGHHNIAWQIGHDRRFRAEEGTIDGLMREIGDFDGDIVLSSEDFENSLRRLDRFAALLGHPALSGRRPVFVIYLRDQASYLESLYQQNLLHGFAEEFEQFMDEALRHGNVTRHEWDYQFDYLRILTDLQSLPGADVLLRGYSARPVIADFLDLLHPDLTQAVRIADPNANQRMQPADALRKFFEIRIERPPGRWQTQAINRLCNHIQPRGVRLRPASLQALADRFQPGNTALSTQLGLDPAALDLSTARAGAGPDAVSIERFFSFDTQLAIAEIAKLIERLSRVAEADEPDLTRQMYRRVDATRRGWLLAAPDRRPEHPTPATPPKHPPAPEPGPEALLGHFESLGDNCEFGIVQRNAGIEPLGFFRFAFAKLDPLIRALDRDFADVGGAEQVEIYTEPNDEAMVRLRDYGFAYHTHIQMGQTTREALHRQQVRVVGFLIRKLLEDLKAGEKIFVRKGADSMRREQIAPLLAALRRHGPVTLLWVVTQDGAHAAGTVEVLEPGLLKGYIDRFAPLDDAYDVGAAWLEICRAALQLVQQRSPPGSVVRGAPTVGMDNLIRHSGSFGGAAWRCMPEATSERVPQPQPLFDGCAVMAHRLLTATAYASGAIHRHSVGQSIDEGKIYVASMFVWIPEDFAGELVGVVFDGFASLRTQNAKLSLRQHWQRVWVTAQVPEGVASATPSLYVIGPQGSRVFTTCWKLERGRQPTPYRPNAPSPEPPSAALAAPAVATPPPAIAGHILKAIRSPAFSLKPPELHNADLIPPERLMLMRRMWDHGNFPERNIVVRMLENVIIADDALIFTDALELVPGSDLHHGPDSVAVARKAIRQARDAGTLATQAGTHVMCKKRGVENYGHWLMEMFPLAVLAQQHVADRDLRYIVPKVQPPLAATIDAAMLGIGLHGGRLLHADGAPRKLERLITIEGLTSHSTYMSPLAVDAVNTLAVDIPAGTQQRLFVMRERGRHRDFADPQAVAALAQSRGFAPFYPGGAGLFAQIAAFAGAQRIVGIMGAGMTNIVFAPRGADVINLAPASMPDVFFWFIAGLRGLRYTEVRCDREGTPQPGRDYDSAVAFPAAFSDLIFPPPG